MSSRIESHSAAVVGTGFIGPVHVEGLRRAGVPVTGADGHREILLCEAVLRSHRERGWVSIEESC